MKPLIIIFAFAGLPPEPVTSAIPWVIEEIEKEPTIEDLEFDLIYREALDKFERQKGISHDRR